MLESRVGLHNVAELFEDGAGIGFSRIPMTLRATLNENARLRAAFTTGCELRFNLHSAQAVITLQMLEQPALIELYHGTFFAGAHIVQTTPTSITLVPPSRLDLLRTLHQDTRSAFDPDLYRVVLPWTPEVRLLALEGELAPPRAGQLPAHRWLAYGSSITQGNSGVRPSGMYAMRAAQRLGVDLLNLGFGGGAHLEPQLADYIASRDDWDFASLELGINLVNRDISEDVFAARVDYFVGTIAAVGKPVFVIDMFPFYGDYDGTLGERPHRFREIVRAAVMEHINLVSLKGETLLMPLHLQSDGLHPSPQGMEEIADNLARTIAGVVG